MINGYKTLISRKLFSARCKIVQWILPLSQRSLHLSSWNREEVIRANFEGPVAELWKSSDFEAEVGLVDLHTHLKRLLWIIGDIAGNDWGSKWHGAYNSLHVSTSMVGLDCYTDVFGQNFMCGTAADFDDAHSKVFSRFVAGQLVFQGVWNAYETVGAICAGSANDAKSSQIRHILSNSFGFRPIFGLRQVLHEAVRKASHTVDFGHPAMHEAIKVGVDLGLGAEHLRQFRNGILHGKISPPEPSDYGPDLKKDTADEQTEMFRAQIRLCLMLIQYLIYINSRNHEFHWYDGVEKVDSVVLSIQSISEEIGYDEEDLPQESLPGFVAKPQFYPC